MSILVKCPNCGKGFNVQEAMIGKQGQCPCGVEFMLTPPPASPIPAPAVKASTPPAAAIPKNDTLTTKPAVQQYRRARWPWYIGGGSATLFLVAITLYFLGFLGIGPIPSAADLPEAWQRDWKTFATAVSQMDYVGAASLEDAFGNRTVQWSGKLLLDLQSQAGMDQWPYVTVVVEPMEVTLRDGELLNFTLHLRATNEQWLEWARRDKGSQIVFRTVLAGVDDDRLCGISEANIRSKEGEILKRTRVVSLHTQGAQIVHPTAIPWLQKDVKTPDMMQLQGTWEIVYSENEGRPGKGDTFEEFKNPVDVGGRYTFQGRTVRYVAEGTKNDVVSTIDIGSSKDPKELDWFHQSRALRQLGVNQDVKFTGIYRLEGDTLTWCYVISTQGRPNRFETSPKDGRTLWKLKRVSSNFQRR